MKYSHREVRRDARLGVYALTLAKVYYSYEAYCHKTFTRVCNYQLTNQHINNLTRTCSLIPDYVLFVDNTAGYVRIRAEAEVAELADALRSGRSEPCAHVGSTPTFGTISPLWGCFSCGMIDAT